MTITTTKQQYIDEIKAILEGIDPNALQNEMGPPKLPKVTFHDVGADKRSWDSRSSNITGESIKAYVESETAMENVEVTWLGDGRGQLTQDGKPVGTFETDMTNVYPAGGAGVSQDNEIVEGTYTL